MANVKNHVIQSNNQKQLIRVIDPTYSITVHANMPETMTIGAGSDVNSPFASFASEGTAANVLALTTGASSKIGITTKRLFMGPDQPDISLDLKFEAYYSAYDEVLIPCIKLMLMGTGEERSLTEDLKNAGNGGLASIIELAETTAYGGADVLQKATGGKKVETDKLINYLRTPAPLKVIFGDLFTLTDVLISNVNVNFSNVLDSQFVPMEASVSITFTPQNPFTKNEILDMFKNRLRVKGI